jgi:formylmethanofuran dehydrogenase subunit E
MSLPLPKLHPDIRHEKRMKQRPWRTLYLRTCNKCGKEMVSVYSVEDTRKVYCEECYRQEVYG